MGTDVALGNVAMGTDVVPIQRRYNSSVVSPRMLQFWYANLRTKWSWVETVGKVT